MSSSGRRKKNIPVNLARYMFFKQCKERHANCTDEFLKLAATVYNPLEPQPQFEEEDLYSENSEEEYLMDV